MVEMFGTSFNKSLSPSPILRQRLSIWPSPKFPRVYSIPFYFPLSSRGKIKGEKEFATCNRTRTAVAVRKFEISLSKGDNRVCVSIMRVIFPVQSPSFSSNFSNPFFRNVASARINVLGRKTGDLIISIFPWSFCFLRVLPAFRTGVTIKREERSAGRWLAKNKQNGAKRSC